MKKALFTFFSGLLIYGCQIKKDTPKITLNSEQTYQFVFWNVENLFDTINDPHTADHEFLPHSDKKWNSFKYYDKVKKIAEGIRASGEMYPPDIVGLAEIENSLVLEDLIYSPPLRSTPYKIAHCPSTDPRGIDLALLYNSEMFSGFDIFKIEPPGETFFRGRPIVWVTLFTFQNDTLDIFLNHWPSKRGGEKANQKRITMANTLVNFTDSLIESGRDQVIITGDFNDSPHSESIEKINQSEYLINCMTNLPNGSHFYRGEYSFLDQIFISKKIATQCKNLKVEVVNENMLTTYSEKYKTDIPFRSWKGPIYMGGFSDHLPLRLRFTKFSKNN